MKTEHFGNKLASLRGQFRMGQKEVASHLKIRQEAYSRMEQSEKRPSDEKLEKLANLYKMSVEQIEAYNPTSNTTNNFYEKVMQVNHIGSMVISSIDNAIEKVIKDPELWNGEEVTLSITFRIVRQTA